jgi:coenzyme F420-0:L-glutamate ligase/coenzyme F420-1:gamma-L-glutamate ligase
VAVVISDTFGRAWRHGLTDVAIGVSGLAAVVDLRGEPDARGRALHVTEVALADEVAGAAELVMGKAAAIPAAIVRGLDAEWFRDGSVNELIRAPRDDLFR